ncbi:2-dehydro-3-deoxygalactonokinase [Cobetia amphilecti]|uniref:2-dehydro-3-deoxygalactonokinase n=1 Tax=Cobetia amphilecti TaxID=1055104 RepID=UPI00244711ED|nr:2-dehydro-3-deoxygalactonokinase [Cobetia litoralis]MDH2422172.1 2-dehydro-3-deoxygalactonokinase [Cobetia litoralis]
MSAVSVTPAWIAVDWGSSNLRAWAVNGDDAVIAQASSARGMLGLAADEFEDVLRVLINDWLPDDATSPMPVLICGMAGARQGWQEAAYLPLPTDKTPSRDVLGALSEQLTHVSTRDSRLAVAIVPGLCQQQPTYDVMRGEETQLAGLVAAQPDYSGAVCLPGTHAKWAHLASGVITGFSTFMSGELYKLLSQDSVLKHSVAAGDLSDAAQRDAYLEGIDTALAAPERTTAQLFGIRARDLLDTALPEGDARKAVLGARLSGLVLGLELAGATVELPDHATITLIGDAVLCQRYQVALEHLGYQVTTAANADMILAGLGRIQRARSAAQASSSDRGSSSARASSSDRASVSH